MQINEILEKSWRDESHFLWMELAADKTSTHRNYRIKGEFINFRHLFVNFSVHLQLFLELKTNIVCPYD